MSTPITALQRERLKLFLRILAISAGMGFVYGAAISPTGVTMPVSMLIGVLNSLGIAGCIAGSEIYLFREGRSIKRLLRLPFVALIALKTLLYAGVVALFVVGLPKLAYLFPAFRAAVPLDRHTELVTIGFSMAMTLIFVIVLQAGGLVGRRTFRNLVLGRYRQPRAERRFFLFVDVIGSTAIAERLGPLQAHRFLAAVFSATAEPIAASGGEIYQFVGDEIVVTWTEEEGRLEARPLHCFFLMEAVLRGLQETFRAQFAAEPGLRAALHLGEVIAGEVGETRRAIVYHGDVMNTASRLEQATRDLGCRFIASAAAIESFSLNQEFQLRDLGALILRGRKEPIRAFAVESSPA
jgi:adenylate cyclase